MSDDRDAGFQHPAVTLNEIGHVLEAGKTTSRELAAASPFLRKPLHQPVPADDPAMGRPKAAVIGGQVLRDRFVL